MKRHDAHAFGRAGDLEIEAVVTRADGTTEDLGVVAARYQHPIRRLVARLRAIPKARLTHDGATRKGDRSR